MHGFSWFDMRGTEGVGFERALRTLLTNYMPTTLPELGRVVRVRFEELRQQNSVAKGSHQTRMFSLMKELIAVSNAYVLFGSEVCNDREFMAAASSYMDETLGVAEILRLIPSFAVPFLGKLTSARFKSGRTMYQKLLSVVEVRCEERDMKAIGREIPNYSDCIQWIMDTAPKQTPWTPQRIVWELMAIWFGACYSLTVTSTFTVQDLGRHPEYVKYLRAELQEQYGGFERTGKGLPLLDSFIKESARQHPIESMSTRRRAMRPFQFSDGTKLEVGDWACTPVHAINHDSTHYPDPFRFNGFRFVRPEVLEKATIKVDADASQSEPSAITEVSDKWQFWGTGRMACPGRYYATMALKVIIGQIITHYDISLPDPNAKSVLTWRSTFLPRNSFPVVLTPISA
ncbi:hypothetical protein GQX73_g6256 [Xylaria multiplex]|uniref:Cytochrome P450 n=1 Tax=Xylaria multiplex TaxID=323545 RepID=A0A7C8MNE6_9PEZI|nr:hypothetical protein GQX73_g6256 [Xylaria multiplex]